MCRKSTCKQQRPCDTTNCRQCLADIIASSVRNPLQSGMLFWHEFANPADLGIDSMNNYPLTMVNSPTQEVGTGVGEGFGLTGGGTGTMAHAIKDWSKRDYDMGKNSWSFAYWVKTPDPRIGDLTFLQNAIASRVTFTVGDSGGVGDNAFTFSHRAEDRTWKGADDPGWDDGRGKYLQDLVQFYSNENVTLDEIREAEGFGRTTLLQNYPIDSIYYDVWTHWAFTFNADNYTSYVYRDGILMGEVENTWPLIYNDRAIYAQWAPTDNYNSQHPKRYLTHSYKEFGKFRLLRGDLAWFNGGVAEPAMWARVLTSQEITALASGLSFTDARNWIPS